MHKIRPYMCEHFKWTSWKHYGVKMPEYACKIKGGDMCSCKGICEDFRMKDEYKQEDGHDEV